MNTKHLRAFAVALLLGGPAFVTLAAPQAVQAATVRPAVGKPLQEAISLAASGNGGAAMAKIREAESVSGLTAGEQQAISQTKEYVAAKTGAGGSATGCKAKFANDYNAGRYRDAIEDADCLRKGGGMSGEDQLIVAQAYYLSGQYGEAIRAAREAGGPTAQELELSAAFKSGDSETTRSVLEDLVSEGKTQYWGNLLTSAENTKGLQDHQTLDIYRLRFLTGSMRNADDYMLTAQLALLIGSPQEAANVVQKGIDAKVLTGDRTTRLLNLAKAQAAKDAAGFSATQKADDAAKAGDADVKLGEEYWGFGRYSDAISAIQGGIKKGVTDQANAQIRLGQAYLGAGQKDAAARAFNSVSKDSGDAQVIAHLWSIYAHTSK